MSAERMKTTVNAYFAAIRELNVDAWLRTFATDAVSHDPVGGMPLEGHAALRGFFEAVAGGFRSIDIRGDQIFVAGQSAAVKWTLHGVGKNGKKATAEGIDVFEFNEHGKIQRLFGYWDPAAMMAQLAG